MEAPYIDIHVHPSEQLKTEQDLIQVLSLMEPSSIPHGFFTAGIHPKDTQSLAVADFEPLWNAPGCVGIGECGLDRRLADIPLKRQEEVFFRQAVIAEGKHLPLILHSVRAHEEIRLLKRKLQPQMPWILHGFRGNERTAMALLDAGFYLSFGTGLLRDAGNMEPYFSQIPLERIFFETDESGVDIRSVYALAASFCGISGDELREKIFDNFKRIFHHG